MITYPLTPPNAFAIAHLQWMPRDVVALSESPFTLQAQVQEFAGQRLEGVLTLPRMKRATAEEVVAFLLKLRGVKGSFLFGDPSGATPRGAGAGGFSPLVNGAAQTGYELATDGWPLSTTVLLPGDYIQLGSGASARLHKVLDTATTNASGQVTLTLWPSLRESPADNAPIVAANCQGVFRLAQNVPWSIDAAELFGLEVPIVERL